MEILVFTLYEDFKCKPPYEQLFHNYPCSQLIIWFVPDIVEIKQPNSNQNGTVGAVAVFVRKLTVTITVEGNRC